MEKKEYKRPEARIIAAEGSLCGAVTAASAADGNAHAHGDTAHDDGRQVRHTFDESRIDDDLEADDEMQNIITEEEEEAEFFGDEEF